VESVPRLPIEIERESSRLTTEREEFAPAPSERDESMVEIEREESEHAPSVLTTEREELDPVPSGLTTEREESEPAPSVLTTEREELEPAPSVLRTEREEINTCVKRKEPALACPSGGRIPYDATFWQNTCDMLSDPAVILKESEQLNFQKLNFQASEIQNYNRAFSELLKIDPREEFFKYLDEEIFI